MLYNLDLVNSTKYQLLRITDKTLYFCTHKNNFSGNLVFI